uniref:Sphingomyelin phosphodiesterase n=1 Tax=Panagrolaimus sp. ES5 TaxID=591445 RepID=A0AC34FQI9_9BILA
MHPEIMQFRASQHLRNPNEKSQTIGIGALPKSEKLEKNKEKREEKMAANLEPSLSPPSNGVRARGSLSVKDSSLTNASTTSNDRFDITGNLSVHVATLNCWALPQPWPFGSKHRRFRIDALIEALKESSFDIVCLQELWSENDFLRIVEQVSHIFPHRHYFHSGYTGSGTCLLSRWKIQSTLIHRYSLNGFPHHVHRGDWFGGKVVGLAEIIVEGYRLCVYTTHLHAEYNRDNDLYLPHRLSQAFELAQFVRHTSRDADLLILTGDFNIEPDDLGYHLIRNLANVHDAWLNREVCPDDCDLPSGMTCDRPDNCYTPKAMLKKKHLGKRLDYILYQSIQKPFDLVYCDNCFDVIPGEKRINYSDHLGVCAMFRLNKEAEKGWKEPLRIIDRRFLEETHDIVSEGEKRIIWDRRFFGAICFLLLLLIFGISQLGDAIDFQFSKYIVILVQFLLTLLLGFSFWYGMISLSIERRSITETIWNINDMLER